MDGASHERFKMLRRNTLRNEVDGSFDDLEAFEDREEATIPKAQVTHQECILLNRVLSDKSKLPPVCIPPRAETTRKASSRRRRQQHERQQQHLTTSTLAAPQDEITVRGIVRQITGAVQPALSSVQPVLSSLNPLQPPKQEMGGVVTEEQCQTLADYLSPSVGGQYLLPTACSSLLLLDAADAADQAELDKAYAEKERREARGVPLKRSSTAAVVKECFPPTVC